MVCSETLWQAKKDARDDSVFLGLVERVFRHRHVDVLLRYWVTDNWSVVSSGICIRELVLTGAMERTFDRRTSFPFDTTTFESVFYYEIEIENVFVI